MKINNKAIRTLYKVEYKYSWCKDISDAFRIVNSEGFPTSATTPQDVKINDFLKEHFVGDK